MAASNSVNDVLAVLDDRLAAASPDLLRSLVKGFAEALMSAEAEAACGAGYRERSDSRVNSRNGYRLRDWDTRAGSIELAIPKLRTGAYFPDWLVGAHVIPQVEAFSAHVIPQGCAHVIPHREGERVVLGVVLAVGRLLPTRHATGAWIGEEKFQRGRCDRDFGSLACGPVAE